MDKAEREQLRSLCEAAAPGPWIRDEQNTVYADDGDCTLFDSICAKPDQCEQCQADAKFIAAARSALPALLAALDERDARIAELKAEIDQWAEREASCCPEDVGFAEMIATLQRQNDDAQSRCIELETQLAAVQGVYDKHELRYYADEPLVPRGSNEAALRALASDLRRALTSGGTGRSATDSEGGSDGC